MHSYHRKAFTLVEILIVVVILGILAAIVVPQFAGASEKARITAFTMDIDTYITAAEYHNIKEGSYPVDGSSGLVPAGFEPYIDTEDWTDGTPIGGVWDTELNDNGMAAGVGVHFLNTPFPGNPFLTRVDTYLDDGDINTGLYQLRGGDRYYYILDP